MHKISVISDTHGLLRPQVIRMLSGCDAFLHSGDFDREEVLEKLREIATVYAVRGNNDDWMQAGPSALPESLSLELYGLRFFMTHDKRDIPRDISGYDVIIFGHSHKYEEIRSGGQLMLNPGSCGPKRFTLPVTMAVLEIGESGDFCVKRVDLEKMPSQEADSEKVPLGIRRIVAQVMKDTGKGIPVDSIASRRHISYELAEQICRLYLTHPGVDVDGILKKMGI